MLYLIHRARSLPCHHAYVYFQFIHAILSSPVFMLKATRTYSVFMTDPVCFASFSFVSPPSRFAGWEYSLVRILPSSKPLSCTSWISLGYGLLCFIGECYSLFLCFFVFEQDRYFSYVIGYWKLMGFYRKQLYLIIDLKYFHFTFRCFYICLSCNISVPVPIMLH